MMKDTVAASDMTAQVSPLLGLYTISARPRMKPPPTNVAVRAIVGNSMLNQLVMYLNDIISLLSF